MSRVDQRLVALHVDHDVVAVQAQRGAGLGQAVAAAGVVFARQHRLHAVFGAGLQDGGAVTGHHDAGGAALRSLARHAHHHGQAGNVGQRLVGQAAGGQARRDQDGERSSRTWRQGFPGSGFQFFVAQRAGFVFQQNGNAVAHRVGQAGAARDQFLALAS
jgi:hypothetical protein